MRLVLCSNIHTQHTTHITHKTHNTLPTPTSLHSLHTLYLHQVVVKFEDDEDEAGRNPARRVPARFVLRRSDVEEGGDDDSEEED